MKKPQKRIPVSPHQTAPRLYFPHFLRIIAAGIGNMTKTLVWLSLFTIVALNSVSDELIDKSSEQQLQRFILHAPFTARLHETLGRYYLSYNSSAALQEFRLADSFNPVLGAQTQAKTLVESVTRQSTSNQQQLAYWTRVSDEFPQYYYALIKRYELAFALGNKKESSQLLTVLNTQYPGNNTVEYLKQNLHD